ncbi:hypothetical protein KVV02_006828 [Mortierella alpina]|uniref:Endonuclease/exonuclease/phosphatase domain-containing protein n=1 Tax=Mortierella alpina TaxID=64518 RepID=A0A9P8A8F5_MORAP|nr:hypothetical protein KVV02_006828 [Mortierella alpina]
MPHFVIRYPLLIHLVVVVRVVECARICWTECARGACQATVGALIERSFRPRRWEALQGCEASLTVVSYNLLSNSLAHGNGKYRSGTYLPDPWRRGRRASLLLHETVGMNQDIVCVQELDEPDYVGDFGLHMGALGYSGVFKNDGPTSGTAWRYSTEKVEVIALSPSETIIQGVDNAGVTLVLEVSLGRKKRQVCAGTTHILNGCDTYLRKLGQLVSIMAAAEIQPKKDPAVPLILTGDFNTRLDSPCSRRTCVHRSHSDAVAEEFKLETWDVREVADSSTFAKTVLDDVRCREVSQSVHTASV